MKKLIPNLMAALVAAGLIAYTGCGGVEEDPEAIKNQGEEENHPEDDNDTDEEDE